MPAYPFFALRCRLPTASLLKQGRRKVREASSKYFGMEGGVRSPPPALASSSLVVLSAERAVNSLPSMHPPRFVIRNVLFVTYSVRYKNFINSPYIKPFTVVCSHVPKLYALLKCTNRDITALTPEGQCGIKIAASSVMDGNFRTFKMPLNRDNPLAPLRFVTRSSSWGGTRDKPKNLCVGGEQSTGGYTGSVV